MLTKDQMKEAKKVELQKFAERGVHEVVDRSMAELNPESVMLSAQWIITNKGTVECPRLSDAIVHDTLFSGTQGFQLPGACSRELPL